MGKRKRKRARRRKAHNPSKKRHTRKKRRHVRNPSRKRRHVRRRRRSNPGRKVRHVRRRRRRHNPGGFKKKRHGRRRSRRNPGKLGTALMLFGVAVAGYLAVQAGGYFTSKDGVTNAQRNRGIIAALLAALGIFYVEKKKPGLGYALGAGSLLGAFGGWLTLKLAGALPAKSGTTTSAVFQDNMSAVFQDNMSAVFQDNMSGYAQLSGYSQMSGIGEMGDMGGYSQLSGLMPGAPWATATPFDAQ